MTASTQPAAFSLSSIRDFASTITQPSLKPNYSSAATPTSVGRCRASKVDASISRWMLPEYLHVDPFWLPPAICDQMPARRRSGCSDRARRRDRRATARVVARDSPACFTCARSATSAKETRRPTMRSGTRRGPRRLPIALGDDDLHGLEALFPLRVVAIARADEAVTELREKLLRALLAWLEMQSHSRTGRLVRAPGWRSTSPRRRWTGSVRRRKGPQQDSVREPGIEVRAGRHTT
jgi:hypothetical protein